MKIIILGCGPAGLMAAQGVSDAHVSNYDGDLQIAIISRKQKSPMFGAQYLHAPIPGATPPVPRPVSYQMRGSADDYRRKVYGQLWSGTVSPEDLASEHQGWDIRATYDNLWKTWEYAIQDAEVDVVGLHSLLSDGPDLVINSIPRPLLCHAEHVFGATEVWAAGDAPGLGIHIGKQFRCPDDMVICNAEDNPSWYRMSRVFGHTTVEWPGSLKMVPVNSASRVQKPTHTNCDCWPTLLHVGRYGSWSKGILSHTAYFSAFKRVDEMMGGRHGETAEAAEA